MRRARRDVDTAARLELTLLGIERPTIEQVAGATLRAMHHADMRALREAYTEEK